MMLALAVLVGGPAAETCNYQGTGTDCTSDKRGPDCCQMREDIWTCINKTAGDICAPPPGLLLSAGSRPACRAAPGSDLLAQRHPERTHPLRSSFVSCCYASRPAPLAGACAALTPRAPRAQVALSRSRTATAPSAAEPPRPSAAGASPSSAATITPRRYAAAEPCPSPAPTPISAAAHPWFVITCFFIQAPVSLNDR